MTIIYPTSASRVTKTLFLSSFILLTVLFSSCEDKDPIVVKPPITESDNAYTNKWIHGQLDTVYLWNNKMPALASLNIEAEPTAFFESVLYKYKQMDGDRFSWIEEYTPEKSMLKSKATRDLGFEYIATYADNTKTKIYFIVIYVKNDSDAQKKGVQRGHVITKVGGRDITINNYYSILFDNKASYSLSIIDFAMQKEIVKDVTVMPAFEENPVLLDSIYVENGHKIGYLVFNSFGSNGDAKDYEDNVYLMNRLAYFESQNITDLVLDLRYNGGGLVRTAVYLGSALVPNRDTKKLFDEKTYNGFLQSQLLQLPESNATRQAWLYDYFANNMTNTANTAIPKLGDKIKSLYILGTGFTASASELIINGLKPYREVKLVGETTVGKNVGSFTVEPEEVETRIKWKMQPITFFIKNSAGYGDYHYGFSPDIEAADFETLTEEGVGLRAFGDREETLLAAAIGDITKQVRVTPKTSKAAKVQLLLGSSLERKKNASLLLIDAAEYKELNSKLKSARK